MRVPEPSERETHSRPERLSTPFHKHVDAFLIRHSPVGHGFTRKLRINTEQLAATKKISPQRRKERGGSVPGSARFQRALRVQPPARRMRALPGARGGKSLAACK